MEVKTSGESAVANLVLPACYRVNGSVCKAAIQVIARLIIPGVLEYAFRVEAGTEDQGEVFEF